MLRANIHLIRKSLILLVLLIVVCTCVFYLPYKVVRDSTIESLNTQQLVLARQAAQGVKTFFHHYEKMLVYLAQHKNIVHLNEDGKALLEELYRINKDEVSAVTRVDARGIIVHTTPFNQDAIGKDISGQSHNSFIISRHEQIVSDVFIAVQGYRTVAYAIPVFDRGQYAGSLTVLIPFEVISKKYVADIVLGEGGYAWMISKKGVELYCPVPGHTGQTIFETSSQFPTVIEMSDEMMKGKQGVTYYIYDRIKNKRTETILKHAVYYPVELPNNLWSIVVATPERQALSAVSAFGKWWLTIFSVLLAGIVAYISFFVRSKLITEDGIKRKLAEEKLKESERLFRRIISSAHVPIMMVTVQGDVEFVNQKCEELYGYNQKDIPTTERWFERAYPDKSLREMVATSWEQEVEAAVRTNNVDNLPSIELPVVCKNGSVKDVSFDYTLIDSRVILTLTDRTEQNSIEKEKQDLLERENRAKKMEVIGLMAGSVAHDLNNILLGIVSYPDILLAQLPDKSELRGPLEAIKESGTRAATVVEDLLTAARGAASSRELHDLHVLIKEYLRSPEHERLKELHPGVRCQHSYSASLAVISCSPVHIKKSLMNLVTNATEAITGEGAITISTHNRLMDDPKSLENEMKPGQYVVLGIEDTGTGIPEEDIEHIFEPFYTKKEMGRSGSGLGLVIVWNSVLDHQGKITVTSGGAGTRFDLYFPVTERRTSARLEIEGEEKPEGRGEHILVVDDEPMLCEIACKILEPQGYIVDTVGSGEEAVAFLKEKKVDLLLLDMIMKPGLNGRQTYEEILKFSPGQKALIVSGYSESEDVKKAIDLGSGGLIKKPFTRKKLQAAVREELNR